MAAFASVRSASSPARRPNNPCWTALFLVEEEDDDDEEEDEEVLPAAAAAAVVLRGLARTGEAGGCLLELDILK